MQRVPALVLDDGTVITESIAICRYFEALRPDPPLFGRGALESALVEMWSRRVELHLFLPVSSIFQHLHPAMKPMVDPQVPAVGRGQQAARRPIPAIPRWRTQRPALCRGAGLHRRRHHRHGGGRFHAGLEARRAGRTWLRCGVGTTRCRHGRAPKRKRDRNPHAMVCSVSRAVRSGPYAAAWQCGRYDGSAGKLIVCGHGICRPRGPLSGTPQAP